MALVAIRCPQCGVTLPVDTSQSTRFCSHCNSKLQIDIPDHGTITLNPVDDNRYYTSTRVKRMALLRLKTQLKQLQRERDIERKKLLLAFSVERAKMFKAASIGLRSSPHARPQELLDRVATLKSKYDQQIQDLEVKVFDCAEKITVLSAELAR